VTPFFSLITVCLNSQDTILDCILSVESQTLRSFQHIIVDGGSTDDTLDIVQPYLSDRRICFTGRDDGIYDAMNRGFCLAQGMVVYYLNSDDMLHSPDVLQQVFLVFKDINPDFLFGNILRRDPLTQRSSIFYSDPKCAHNLRGRQIPHPALFVKRSLMSQLGPPFDSRLKIAGDLQQQLFLVHRFNGLGFYENLIVANMRLGGLSTSSYKNMFLGLLESALAYYRLFGIIGFYFTILKALRNFFSRLQH
jgi:glycosyltransferase involved in cell wall biosynthesis